MSNTHPVRIRFRSAIGLLAALILVAAPAAAAPASIDPAAAAAWGFDRSDLTPHPGVRFGVLPNGMRYVLMRHAGAGDAKTGLSVRLHLDAGSSAEAPGQAGYMHLIEHMIFHGSANLPKGALLTLLPHAGLRRWSDFGATTSYDETVYALELGKADARARTAALMVMREVCSHLRFGRAAVRGAKADVRSEIRARDAVADRIATAQNEFFVPGTPIARGPVAGTDGSVARAGGSALSKLYARTYVPARTTLVMVGDFDPDAAEAEIGARFADWLPAAAALDPPPPVVTPGTGLHTRLFVDRAAPTVVTIAAVAPLGGADAGAGRDAAFLQNLGSEMLARRLTAGPGTRVLRATAAVYDHFSTARLALIEMNPRDRDWRTAVRHGAIELDRALKVGFTQAELDEQLRVSRRAPVADDAPRTATSMADAIVDAVGRDIVFTAPSDRSGFEAYLARVRLVDVNAAFRTAWAGGGRFVFVSHDRAIPGGEAAIAEAWTRPGPASL